jgi:hypothetical protein
MAGSRPNADPLLNRDPRAAQTGKSLAIEGGSSQRASHGIGAALFAGMFIQVTNPVSGRRGRIHARALAKVLHLATFHGWRPERIGWRAPIASWDTRIVMPYVTPYLSGVVSNSDAAGLVIALKDVLSSEGSGLASDIYLAVLGVIAIAEGGGFELNAEITSPEKDEKASASARAGGPSRSPIRN